MAQTIECYKCGAQNEFGQRFCTECGEKFSYRCPQCNAVIEQGNKSCGSCGVKLDWGIEKQETVEATTDDSDETYDTETDSGKRLNRKHGRKVPWVPVFITIVVCIAVVFGVDAYLRDKAAMNIPHKESIEKVAEIDLKITAEKLSSEYMADEDIADAKYKGKVLSVTGMVTGIDENLVGTYFVKLSGGSIADIEIQCIFDKNSGAQVAALQVDETITVSGICDGAYAAVKLVQCEIPVTP